MTTYEGMTGTDKQIEWASRIRTNVDKELAAYIAELDKQVDNQKRKGQDADTVANLRAQVRRMEIEIIAWLDNQTEASWWIDNRHDLDSGHNVAQLARKLGQLTGGTD